MVTLTVTSAHLSADPLADDVDYVLLLLASELHSWRDVVPLGQAGPTARSGRMLGHEHGVPSIGRLLAVLVRMGRRQPLLDQLICVPAYGLGTAQLCDGAVASGQTKPRTKRLRRQPIKPCVDVPRGPARHEMTMRPTFWNSLMSE